MYRKHFCETREAVLSMSWANFIMDLASVADYDYEEKEGKEKVGSKDANDFWPG